MPLPTDGDDIGTMPAGRGPGLVDRGIPPPDDNGDGTPTEARMLTLVEGTPANSEDHAPRFELWTAAELAELPPVGWTVEQMLPTAGLSVPYGQPGHLKTFWSLALFLAVTTGRPCFGHATTWGPGVWVSTEGGWGLAERIRAWQDANEVADLTAAYFVREPVNLLEEGQVSAFLADIAHAIPGRIPPKIVTFDTLHGSMVGGDENDAGNMGRVIESCRRISRTTGAHVQLVHHMSKDARWERGSGSLRAAADAMFRLEYEDGILTVTNDKQRDAPPVAVDRLRLVTVGGSCVLEPLEGTPPVALTDTDRRVAHAIQEVSIDGETTTPPILEVAKASRASVYRSLARLVRLGYVAKRRGKYTLTVAGEATCLTGSR